MGNTCAAPKGQTRCLVLTQDYLSTAAPLNCKIDGERFAALAQSCGVKDMVLDHDGSLESAKTNIAKFGKRSKAGDTFVLFFAGHGMSVADVDGDEEDGLDEALCFTDENGTMTQETALTDDSLALQLTEAFAAGVKVLMIMDCCHSGTIGDLEKACWKGREAIAMSACQDYQESVDTGSGGMLTGLILETLEDLVANAPTNNLSMQMLVDSMQASEHYATFSENQQINLTKTDSASADTFAWPLCPEMGFSVDAFDNELGEGLLDPANFVSRAAEVPTDFASAMVYYHNIARAAHGAGPVEWDDTCAEHAQMAADECAAEDTLKHCYCGEFEEGQNAAMITNEKMDPIIAAQMSVRMWYDELNTGPFQDGMEFTSGTGHFTQVVWKGTTKIGAGMAGRYVQCNYSEAGNMGGAFGENVSADVTGDVDEVMDETAIKVANTTIMLEENADYLSYIESDEGARATFLEENPHMEGSGIAGM